jgi:predicted secreted protein
MGVAGSVMMILIVWWLVLFCLLPIGVRGQWEEGEIAPGSEPGAPQQTHLLKKGVWAFAITMAIWAITFWWLNFGSKG